MLIDCGHGRPLTIRVTLELQAMDYEEGKVLKVNDPWCMLDGRRGCGAFGTELLYQGSRLPSISLP